MDRFVVKGVRKLFSLTKTKIRLAEDVNTKYTKPTPLPLVKILSNINVSSVEDAKKYREKLASEIDYNNPESISSAVLQLMDIIEGVKYKFEPSEYCVLIDEGVLREIEQRVLNGERVNILLMSEKPGEGTNLYIGYDPPKDAIHYGRVPTNLAHYMAYALSSDILSKNLRLINTNIILGHRTIILNAICYTIRQYGAKMVDEYAGLKKSSRLSD